MSKNNVQAARAALTHKMREVEALKDQLAQKIKREEAEVSAAVSAITRACRERAEAAEGTVEDMSAQVIEMRRTLRVTQAEAMDNSERAEQYRTISQNTAGLLEAEERTTRLLQAGVIALSVLVVGLSLALVGI